MASDVHSERETVESPAAGDLEPEKDAAGFDGEAGSLKEGPARSVDRGGADRPATGSDAESGSGDADFGADDSAADHSSAADQGRTTGQGIAADRSATADRDDDAELEPADEPTPQRPRRLTVLLVVAALALALDIGSKLLVVAKLSDHDPVRLPGGFLNLVLVRNPGAAFSIGTGQTWIFTLIALAVAGAILRISRNLRSLPWACALGLLLGGALGNLGDRVFRSPGLFRGHVVDFLQFPTFPVVNWDFPVFNLADSAIVVGGCLMVLLSFLGIQTDGTRHVHARDAQQAEPAEDVSDDQNAADVEDAKGSRP